MPAVFALPADAAGAVEEMFSADARWKPAELIVEFHDSANARDRAEVIARHGLRSQEHLTPETELVSTKGDLEDKATALLAEPDVVLVEPNYELRPAALPNDPMLADLWGLDNPGAPTRPGAVADVDIDAVDAWNRETGDAGVVVAVIDTGVDIDHPELRDKIWTNPDEVDGDAIDNDANGYVDDVHGWDFFNDDASVFDSETADSHGTHVAGTIAAAQNNGIGITGVAPNVTIMPLKFIGFETGYTSDAIRAVEYATAEGVRISNNSWGGSDNSVTLRNAIAASNMVFVAAAGNSNSNNDSAPMYPASYDLPNIISVAAVDHAGGKASFSSYGVTTVDIAAPGVNIVSTLPTPRQRTVAIANESPASGARSMFWGLGLEDVASAQRVDFLAGAMAHLQTAPSDPVLFIDDDASGSSFEDTATAYLGTLAAAGYTDVSTVTVASTSNGPDLSSLTGKTVVWSTGAHYGSSGARALRAADLVTLTNFLEGGGKLLLVGSDTIYGNEHSSLVTEYLGVDFLDEGWTVSSASGVPGTVYDGGSFDVSGSASPDGNPARYRDELRPRGANAHGVLYLPALTNSSYQGWNGTSMATPHVAGVAALLLSHDAGLSTSQVISAILDGATPLASFAGKSVTGGMVNASTSLNIVEASVTASNVTVDEAATTATITLQLSPRTSRTVTVGYSTAAQTATVGDDFVAKSGTVSFAPQATGASISITLKPDNVDEAHETFTVVLSSPTNAVLATSSVTVTIQDDDIPAPPRFGYRLPTQNAAVSSFGSDTTSLPAITLNAPVVATAGHPTGNGYWLVASDGGVLAHDGAPFHGSTGAMRLNQPIVGMAPTISGNGYWLVASDGGIFAFGDALFYGSTGNIVLNKPIVGMAATASGNGYWLVASDGGIFAFGDALFYGSTGNIVLNKPIVGMASTASGNGYWLVASDGGIFAFGDARFYGSTGNIVLNKPIVGMASTASGNGYWLVASDGGIFTFGDATFFGSSANLVSAAPVVGIVLIN